MNIRKMEGTRVESATPKKGTEATPQVRKMGATLGQQMRGGSPEPTADTGSMKKKATTRATTGGGKKGY